LFLEFCNRITRAVQNANYCNRIAGGVVDDQIGASNVQKANWLVGQIATKMAKVRPSATRPNAAKNSASKPAAAGITSPAMYFQMSKRSSSAACGSRYDFIGPYAIPASVRQDFRGLLQAREAPSVSLVPSPCQSFLERRFSISPAIGASGVLRKR